MLRSYCAPLFLMRRMAPAKHILALLCAFCSLVTAQDTWECQNQGAGVGFYSLTRPVSKRPWDADAVCRETAQVTGPLLAITGEKNGDGYRPKISGGHKVIIFIVANGAELRLEHLELQHGFSEDQQGAAIRNEGILVAKDCVFAGNHAVGRTANGVWNLMGNSGFQRNSAFLFASSDIRVPSAEITWQAAIWSGAESITDLDSNFFFAGCDEDVEADDCANPGKRVIYSDDGEETVSCCYRSKPHGLLQY